MHSAKNFTLVILIHSFLVGAIVLVLWNKLEMSPRYVTQHTNKREYNSPEDFEFFDNETGTEDGSYIVPNIIHFVRWHNSFSFIDIVCLLAAFKNQNPEKIYIHTDQVGFDGKYWKKAFELEPRLKEVVELKYLEVPEEIFGQEINPEWKYFHGGDVARLRVLMKYGGIFLDNDSFIIRCLDEFRKFEMTLGWQEGLFLANQVILANKNARFLIKWLNSYRHNYQRYGWYYNAGERPTTTVLMKEPYLIHRMKRYFNDFEGMLDFMYLGNHPEWKRHYAIHLLSRHTYVFGRNLTEKAVYPVTFNETNIVYYDITVREMVKSVYPLEMT